MATLIANQLVLAVNPTIVTAERFPRLHRVRPPRRRAAVLRLDRQRQPAPPRHGAAEAAGRHRAHPCALQGRRSRGHCGRRPARPWRCSAAARSCRWSSRASSRRSPSADASARRCCPELPTIGELYPGYEVTIWQALFAPVGTPPAIVDRLRSEVNAVLAHAGSRRAAPRRRRGRAARHDARGVRRLDPRRPRQVRQADQGYRRDGGLSDPCRDRSMRTAARRRSDGQQLHARRNGRHRSTGRRHGGVAPKLLVDDASRRSASRPSSRRTFAGSRTDDRAQRDRPNDRARSTPSRS